MEAIQLDGDILFGLLKRVAPRVHRHLKSQGVEPILYMTEWFLCIFSRTLPWPSVLRIWDMFLCEGVKVLFRVGLVLLKSALPRKVRRKCPSMYETLDVLKHLPDNICTEEFLIPEVLKLDISEEDMEREHRKQLKRRQQKQEEGRASSSRWAKKTDYYKPFRAAFSLSEAIKLIQNMKAQNHQTSNASYVFVIVY